MKLLDSVYIKQLLELTYLSSRLDESCLKVTAAMKLIYTFNSESRFHFKKKIEIYHKH